MSRKNLEKTKMALLDPNERIYSFDEVSQGYTTEEAIAEAQRCLDCKHKPCISGCPVGIDIPAFINEIKQNNMKEAYEILSSFTSLPAVCGRVCPQETQCEAKCVRGIKGEPVAIGALERYVADMAAKQMSEPLENKMDTSQKNGIKIAVVGSGPAGLSCAGTLVSLGYKVTIFEALHETGGVLRYGIPEFRLPKSIVDHEISQLIAQGVKIEKNMVIGRTLDLEDLEKQGFEAIFLGTGAGLPKFMNIEGEHLNGVYSANEYLTRVNLMKACAEDSQTPLYVGEKVAVVGGGNVAMDAARCAKRMGAKEVYLVYRRSEQEMPARLEEQEHAKEEGIVFKVLCNPLEIIGDEMGEVRAMKCVSMALGETDEAGRRRPEVVGGSEHFIPVDQVIMSIGTKANPIIQTMGIEVDKYACIATNELGRTSRMNVYAGGDAVTGAATVIEAMGAGKKCAMEIHRRFN